MARINLLPWREAQRKERQRQFAVIAGGAVIIMIGIWALAHIHFVGKIENQVARNDFLKGEISKLDKKIKKIKELEKEKANLLARMQIIQQLQRRRPEIVHVFDELVTTIPDGVNLTSIKNSGSSITLDGIAQSNARVSSYMRNIESSKWLGDPKLSVIQTNDKRNERTNTFTLIAQQINQASKDKEQDK